MIKHHEKYPIQYSISFGISCLELAAAQLMKMQALQPRGAGPRRRTVYSKRSDGKAGQMLKHPISRRALLRAGGAGLLSTAAPGLVPNFMQSAWPRGARRPQRLSAKEAPMLAERVAAGTLPPLAERLPAAPLVITPAREPRALWRRVADGDPQPVGLGLALPHDRLRPTDALGLEVDASEPRSTSRSSSKSLDDAKRFIIHMRKGVKWSDGAPFTSADIMFAYDDVLRNENLYPTLPVLADLGRRAGGLHRRRRLHGGGDIQGIVRALHRLSRPRRRSAADAAAKALPLSSSTSSTTPMPTSWRPGPGAAGLGGAVRQQGHHHLPRQLAERGAAEPQRLVSHPGLRRGHAPRRRAQSLLLEGRYRRPPAALYRPAGLRHHQRSRGHAAQGDQRRDRHAYPPHRQQRQQAGAGAGTERAPTSSSSTSCRAVPTSSASRST